MGSSKNLVRALAYAGISLLAGASAALADGEPSIKDAAPEGRQFTYAITIGGTSDYVFRGFSQSDENPAFQAAVDIGYGIFYAGAWGSGIDFEFGGSAEVDLYAGIKPVLGPVTFDAGVIYYSYPDQGGPLNVDYVELKLGASVTPITNLSLGVTGYWSPEYTFETGEVWTVEGYAGYTLPQFGIFTPTISGLYGYEEGEEDFEAFNGFDSYSYWNAGLALAVEKFTFDFRYWDTDVDSGLADERFVFSFKVVLP